MSNAGLRAGCGQAGAGLMWKLGENRRGTGSFSLRPEIKARWDDAGREDFVDYIATMGFQFSFGSAPTVAAAPPTIAAPSPAPAPIVASSADTDGDGVLDASDRCPNTPRGTTVDEHGCPQTSAITLDGVNFETDSATLTRESLPVLDRLADTLRKHPQLEIELQGHTDSSGSDQYNLRLSQQRADAVRAYLMRQIVPSAQVLTRGYGESEPISDNSTIEGRAKNRRVAVAVLRNPGNVNVVEQGKR